MSAEDNAPASDQADIGEALVAALGFEPTEGLKQGRDGDGGGGAENGSSQATKTSSSNRRSKKSRRKNRRGPNTNSSSGSSTNSSSSNGGGGAGVAGAAAVAAGAAAGVDDKVTDGVKSALDGIKSAAKPSVSDRSKIVVGGDEELEESWVSVDGPDGEQAKPGDAGQPNGSGTDTSSAEVASPAKVDADAGPDVDLPDAAAIVDDQGSDDTVLVGGPPVGGAEPAKVADLEQSAPAVDAVSDVTVVADETIKVDIGVEKEAAAATAAAAASSVASKAPETVVASVASIAPAEVKPGMAVPSAPPVVEARADDPEFDPARTGEIRRIETRDDEIQSNRIEAEIQAKAEGREVFERGSLINLFRRSRRLQSRKVRRVIRHVDPWSVLTFSVLFHLCVFAALLLASVLVWNAAEAAGTIEDLEGFILELGDYETFEIKGDVVFRAAVAIAGILTLASSVLLVLLTVVFNLISDLVGGIRMTVIEEETVRVRRKAGDPAAGANPGG